MAAPRSINFQKDVFGWVIYEFVECLADDYLNGFVIGFGNGSGFQELFKLAHFVIDDEVGDGRFVDLFAIENMFSQGLSSENNEFGFIAEFDTEIGSEIAEFFVSIVDFCFPEQNFTFQRSS
jgi:hypothetical protein